MFYAYLFYKHRDVVVSVMFQNNLKVLIDTKIDQHAEVMQPAACLVVNPINAYSRAALFRCRMEGLAVDSVTSKS